MTGSPGIRRLSVKLGFVIFISVAGALAIVYLAVLPQLESRLVGEKIRDLERSSRVVQERFQGTAPSLYTPVAEELGSSLSVRVVVFEELNRAALRPIADSGVSSSDVQRDPVALETAETGLRVSDRVEREESDFAEVAVPIDSDTVVLISAPLNDALADVRLVRRSLLFAGAVALLVAWVAGFLASWSITRRVGKFEAAAERIAGGDFDQPVHVSGRDEITQLGEAFESMRLRLAHLDRARREFIANASHELRTPLFSLGGFLELLLDEDLDDDTRQEFLVEMKAQVDRLTRLATDLLDLSRLDAGQLAVEVTEFDLTGIARTVTEEFRGVAESDGCAMNFVESEHILAFGDEQRVLQIARILAENAIRHTPSGTRVDVAVRRWEARAILDVQDRGPGIPKGDLEHLFERFYRADGGKTSGSGLGLAIAHELSRKMDAAVSVRSGTGETTFTLSLPLAHTIPGEPFSHENGGDHGAQPGLCRALAALACETRHDSRVRAGS